MSLVVFFQRRDAGRAYCDALAVLSKERPVRLDEHARSSRCAWKRRVRNGPWPICARWPRRARLCDLDTNKYPDAKKIEELRPILMPVYIRNLPTTDAWGTPFAYFVSPTSRTTASSAPARTRSSIRRVSGSERSRRRATTSSSKTANSAITGRDHAEVAPRISRTTAAAPAARTFGRSRRTMALPTTIASQWSRSAS